MESQLSDCQLQKQSHAGVLSRVRVLGMPYLMILQCSSFLGFCGFGLGIIIYYPKRNYIGGSG